MSAHRYRADIDGLRALAVLAVALFHARLGLLPGGFVGVDVFFVISGYLITSIILAEMAAGNFTVSGFYERRIRRIIPALLVVTAACTVIGWYVLPPRAYSEFASSAVAAAAFYSNFYFNGETGYFAAAAETRPLLHTWSLAVEEQFYLVAPVFILLVAGHLRPLKGPILGAAFAASLGLSAYGAYNDWSSAFYLPLSRAFELLMGVGLAFGLGPRWTSGRANEIAALSGLAMIGAAALLYDAATPFPGIAALLPCLGTALVIRSGAEASTSTHRLLATAPTAFMGKVSYSFYLWHWPLLAFAGYEFGRDLRWQHRVGLLLLALMLSIVTYFLVEQPIRRRTFLRTRPRLLAATSVALICCVVSGRAIVATNGAPFRLSPDVAAFAQSIPTGWDPRGACMLRSSPLRADASTCSIGSKSAGAPTFLLWGDSHGLSLLAGVSEAAAAHDIAGYAIVRGGCPPLLGLENYGRLFRKCLPESAVVKDILDNPSIREVILIGRWAIYSEGAPTRNELNTNVRRFVAGDVAQNRAAFAALLRTTVEQLRADGRTVTIIGPVPELPFDLPTTMVHTMMRGRQQEFSVDFAEFRERQAAVLAMLDGLARVPRVRVLYPHRYLCADRVCRTVENGTPLYRDDDHLSPAGVRLLGKLIDDAVSFEQ